VFQVFLVNVVIQWVIVVNQRILVVSLWSISCAPGKPGRRSAQGVSWARPPGWSLRTNRPAEIMMQTEATVTAAPAVKPISRKQRQRALATARQARHRDRRKRGIALIRVEVFEHEIDALIRRRLIDAERRFDRSEIRAGLYKLFDSTIGRW
jgi:hypothetical protein